MLCAGLEPRALNSKMRHILSPTDTFLVSAQFQHQPRLPSAYSLGRKYHVTPSDGIIAGSSVSGTVLGLTHCCTLDKIPSVLSLLMLGLQPYHPFLFLVLPGKILVSCIIFL